MNILRTSVIIYDNWNFVETPGPDFNPNQNAYCSIKFYTESSTGTLKFLKIHFDVK